jgi:hypothetical protein
LAPRISFPKMSLRKRKEEPFPGKCKKLKLKHFTLEWLEKQGLLKALDCFLGKSQEIEVYICVPGEKIRPPEWCGKICTCPEGTGHMINGICEERCMDLGDKFVLVRDKA